MDHDQQEFAQTLFSDLPADQFQDFVESLGTVLARIREASTSPSSSPDPVKRSETETYDLRAQWASMIRGTQSA
jgi:hypothetical protein